MGGLVESMVAGMETQAAVLGIDFSEIDSAIESTRAGAPLVVVETNTTAAAPPTTVPLPPADPSPKQVSSPGASMQRANGQNLYDDQFEAILMALKKQNKEAELLARRQGTAITNLLKIHKKRSTSPPKMSKCVNCKAVYRPTKLCGPNASGPCDYCKKHRIDCGGMALDGRHTRKRTQKRVPKEARARPSPLGK